MGNNSMFSRPGDGDADERDLDDPPRGVGAAEGVRVIGASEAAEAIEKGSSARRKPSDEPRVGDRPDGPPEGVVPVASFPLSDDGLETIERPRPMLPPDPPTSRLSSVSDATGQHPVISIGASTSETEMPHWTSSATGEVPRVVIGAPDDGDDSWSSYATSGPRWRDQASDWDGASFADLAADLGDDESVRVGALAPQVVDEETLTHDEYLGFDDLDMPDAAPPQADHSKVSARGTAADPIRIGSAERTGERPEPRGPAARRGPAITPGSGGAAAATAPTAPTGPRDIRAAAQYGVGIAVFAALCLFFGKVTTTLLITVILFVSIGEFFSAVKKLGFSPLAPIGLAATAALPIAAATKGEAGIPIVLFLTLVVGALWYIVGVAEEHPMANLGVTLLGVVYVGVFGSFAALMLALPEGIGGKDGAQGSWVLLLAIFAAVFYDIGGLFGGRRFGKRPLNAASPNKTVEGLLCGCGASFLIVLIVGQIVGPVSGLGLVVVALGGALIAPVGDLTESLMKRDLGIKDFSDLIPGHGGVLDRFDSLLFVLPTAYFLTRAALGI